MVEGETPVAHDRPYVAAVIYNRLRLGMTLELFSASGAEGWRTLRESPQDIPLMPLARALTDRRVLAHREEFVHGRVSTENCLNCGEVLRGQHCSHCGQRAKVRVLSLGGDAMVTKLAGGYIRPHLDRLEGRAFPLLAYFLGKRFYCSWVCGCGGLANTAGEPFRHLSDKSPTAWRIEKVSIYSVLFLSLVATAIGRT